MHTRLKELFAFTKTKFGLDNYVLHTHTLYRNVNIFNDTVYTLCMEWFPVRIAQREDEEDSNPEGTAVIDINVNSRLFEKVIFVGGKSYASGVAFPTQDKHEIVEWIENETTLIYGEHFQLIKEGAREYRFRACMDRIDVWPSGSIEINFDEAGKLIKFLMIGNFPEKEQVEEEKYSLSLEDVEQLAKEQLKLIEFPSYDKKLLVPTYGLEEIYVTNDRTATIPFEINVEARSYLKIDEIMVWNTSYEGSFERKKLSWNEEVTIEQALSVEPHPDSLPLTKLEQEKSFHAVKDFLRQVYPNDTGNWMLKTLHRDKGYIYAILKAAEQANKRLFQRKLLIIIDGQSLRAINYMDNKSFLDIFNQFQAPEKITINKEEAFKKIRDWMTLKPYYVYNFEQKRYVLCGKLDCHYGVDAASGEVFALNNI